MSKELTPLKALKDLREDAKHHLDHHIIYLNERLDIIEKQLKALEIIKEKEVNVGYLEYHFERGNGGYREYVRTMNTPYLDYYPSSKMLTKEEFGLLKEELL